MFYVLNIKYILQTIDDLAFIRKFECSKTSAIMTVIFQLLNIYKKFFYLPKLHFSNVYSRAILLICCISIV